MKATTPHSTADGARRLRAGLADQWTVLIDVYEDHLAAGRAEHGVANLIDCLRRLAAWFTRPPWALKTRHLIEALASIDCSPGFKNYLILAVRGLFSWAYRTHRTPANPAASLPTIPEHQTVDVEAVARRLRASLTISTPKQRKIILLAACAGLTPYEIATLHSRNLDHERQTITAAAFGAPRVIRAHPGLLDELDTSRAGWIFHHSRTPDHHVKASTIRRTVAEVMPSGTSLDTANAAYAQDFYTADPIMPSRLLTKGLP